MGRTNFSTQGIDKKKAVIGDLLYRAYMIDAITDEEVKQVCAMFEIKYLPALLENQNEANRGGTCEGAVMRRIKAVKVGRGLWLKPGAKVKGGAK